MPTHDVFNVPPAWTGVNLFDDDSLLRDALRAAGAGPDDLAALGTLGSQAGTEQAQDWARLANSNPPVLRTHDRYGHRIDEVEFHPAWHQLMTVAVGNGLHAAPWAADAAAQAHLVRAAGFYVWGQVEQGHCCPISMSYAIVPALRHSSELAARYEPGLTSRHYDFGLAEPSTKAGLLAGMAMTEKQGGSDVRANTTTATPTSDGSYRITGHKWFCSAPMCDVFLVLAQAPGGLSCFLVPRVLPDGSRNVFAIQRLKDKLGNKSNASSEVEFDRTTGWLVGEEGRGVPTIIDMVTMTRLDCVIGSASLQRAALTQAMHHVANRSAFGNTILDQPLMAEVISDLAVEVAASAALMLRLATAVDNGETDLLRLAVAAGKFWICKRTPIVVSEALECLGGAGYVEESPLPRYFRESPLNSIWEGSGNVIALDVIRALHRNPAAGQNLDAELDSTAGRDPRLDADTDRLRKILSGLGADPDADARQARTVASLIARTLQASLLIRATEQPTDSGLSTAPGQPSDSAGRSAVAEAFLSTRLGDAAPTVFGTAGSDQRIGTDTRAVIARTTVAPK
ncbi:MAG TPA: acyl-CoA dehydrogenase family protein [Jatrophihabitans sp.]